MPSPTSARAAPGGTTPTSARRRCVDPVEANSRLTATTGSVIFILLAIEGVTVVGVRTMLALHVFIGMLLIPVVALKMATTSWRFIRYYSGDEAFRRKGPPPFLLRLLGPFVVALSAIVLASGVGLMYTHGTWRRRHMLLLHKASFVLWFGAMAVHVLGHLRETGRMAPLDLYRSSRKAVRGASLRLWIVAFTLAAGGVLGAIVLPRVGPWLASSAGIGGH